jgi:hypothetical protein
MKQAMTWVSRRLGWDRNPLRRPADRVEAAVFAGLLAGFLMGAPVSAIVAGRVTDATELRQQHSEQAWRQVAATVLVSSGAVTGSAFGSSDAWVPARWPAPGHRTRRGLVELDGAARAGQQVGIWTNAAGRLTGPPLTRQTIQLDVTLATLIAPAALALVLLAAGGAVRLVLNRRRLAAWDAAWDAIGPRWTPQP